LLSPKITIILLFIIFAFSTLSQAQEEKEESKGKFSGYMFGDYYYNTDHHNPDIKGLHGFWFRRIYFTYDYNIGSGFSTRLRLEMNNNGDYENSRTIIPFVKDAFLAYKFGNQKAIFGISQTPTFGLIEKIWGYRSVEKTPLDEERMASSRDFGLVLKGQFDNGGMFRYHAMIANGSGNKQEIDKGKSFMMSLSYWPTKSIVFQIYGDYADRAGQADTYINQAFLGYNSKTLHGGLQYSMQVLKAKNDTLKDVNLSVLSVFLAGNIFEKIKLFGRVDHMFEPNPFGEDIAYSPTDTTSSFFRFIAGIDFIVVKDVSIIPNIQYVKYDANDEGITPADDLYARLTFFWRFK